MVDFSVFDSILDAAFVVDADGQVAYCNDPGATLCQTSVRRVVGKARLGDLFQLKEDGILPFGPASRGYAEPTPFIETEFSVPKAGKTGTCQLAVRPLGQGHWAFFVRDVSLEEALHSKYRSELAQKEEYARNLEKLVEARTAELRRVNQTLGAILDSLGQGFFTFDEAGQCGNVYTKACEDVLEGVPKDRSVWDVLGVPAAERDQFRQWSETLFREYLPFDDMKSMGPGVYPHSASRRVILEYYPIRREDQSVGEIVVVATDKTAEFEAQQALEIERQFASMIVKYTKNKDQFLRFLGGVGPTLADWRTRALERWTAPQVDEAFRVLHTLEGEAGTFSLRELRLDMRTAQQILEPYRGLGVPEMPTEARTRLAEALAFAEGRFASFLKDNDDVIQIPAGQVGRTVELTVTEAEALLTQLRVLPGGELLAARYQARFLTVPIAERLRYFDGLMSSVADKLGKRVHPLVITGGDLRVYPEPYEGVFTSMVHAFRNAVDHGLESPTDREWAGKDPAGTIRVDLREDGGMIYLVIRDDGKGIDPAAIRAKMKSKFPDQDFDSPSDDEIIQSVCRPGFSSRDEVGEFSGRGVGLDALREEVVRLGGSLVIRSKINEGTAIELSLPKLDRPAPSSLRSA